MKMKSKETLLVVSAGILLSAAAGISCCFFSIICGIICFLFGLILTVVFFTAAKIRDKRIEELNGYLQIVCSGNYDLDVRDNKEGELSILKNNIYKVILLLRSSNDALKKDKVYLADSLTDISHQLKTPLTSIMMMTDLIKEETQNKKCREFASIIENQNEKMKWLITNLLKISKLDAGTADFKRENVSISSVIEESLRPFMITLDLKEIDLVTDIKDFSFRGDKKWTAEAIQNIIKNCIEGTDKGGRIKISTSSTNVFNQVIIEDNGMGICKEDLPHIFERFYHGKNASEDSVGIGLALAKTIVEQEKGDISVASKLNEGTKFTVKFYKVIV